MTVIDPGQKHNIIDKEAIARRQYSALDTKAITGLPACPPYSDQQPRFLSIYRKDH